MNKKFRKIAVVDDEESILISTSLMLRVIGYEYAVFESSTSALEYLSSNDDIDIILLDLMMPKIDGYHFLKLLDKEILKKTKVIIHTGVENQDWIDKCLAIGASDYIKKPYSKQELIELLDKH